MQRSLADNAAEFVNSNRGTYAKDEKVFRASSLYDRNRVYFNELQPLSIEAVDCIKSWPCCPGGFTRPFETGDARAGL